MNLGVVTFILTLSAPIGAVVAAALGGKPSVLGFVKSWAVYGFGLAGILFAAVFAGQVARSAMCASVWYAECSN